jgi:hypothetical protein
MYMKYERRKLPNKVRYFKIKSGDLAVRAFEVLTEGCMVATPYNLVSRYDMIQGRSLLLRPGFKSVPGNS